MHRTWGGLVAGSLFILPSFFILAGLSYLYMAYGSVPAVAAFFYGIKPAVVAIVALAAWRVGRRVIHNLPLALVAVAALVALFAFAVPFPFIVLGAALIGAIGARILPAAFSAPTHAPNAPTASAALIDDDTPPPVHATFSWRRLSIVLVSGVVLWSAAMGLLMAFAGAQGTLPRMAAFFSKAALVTFGGAYAVLPYVNQGAVAQYGWLSASQMIDGLALGESTPGPLIMVVTFVGYVGAWSHAASPALSAPLAGLAGAAVVTFFTFLPSFIFIFAGGPLVEATRGRRLFTAPLTAVTAAVVGVIANLALFFALHVFWPRGIALAPDWISVAIALAAGVALFGFRTGVIPVILGCGVLGVLVL
jgi:chromate transporter